MTMTNEELVARIKAGIDVADNMLQLWNQTRRFIHGIAKRYSGHAELDDLEQEGYLALYDAIDGYKPEMRCRFLTYAECWIKQRMARYIQHNTSVRLPAHEWQRVREYKKMVNAFHVYLGRKPTQHEIAYNMGLSFEEVAQLEKSVEMAQTGSLDVPLSEEGDGTLADMIPTDTDIEGETLDDIEAEELKKRLWMLVDALPDVQPEIIRGRYQKKMTLKQIGENLGVTREKVRQQEAKGIRQLRETEYCRQIWNDIYSDALHGGGVARFKQTWTSSTERVAIHL